jgi:hypothetical protein
VKLLVDNNLSPKLGRGLAKLFEGEHQVEHIRDKFGTGSLTDEEWIKLLGAEGGWCILSGDRRIATNKLQRGLFLANNLIGFFPKPAVMDLPFARQVSRLLYVWPAMEALAGSTGRGCYAIGIKGSKLDPL